MPGTIPPIDTPVTLVGAAPLAPEVLSQALALAPRALAADGGAAALMATGTVPEHVVGDLDSLPDGLRRALAGRVIEVADQDTTDLQKCLALIDAPLILGAGFIGGRLDHTVAALCAIAAEGARPVVLLGPDDAVMHLGAQVRIDLPPGARVSLMPLARRSGSTFRPERGSL